MNPGLGGRQSVDVAACIVRAPDGRVLLAERTARQISPGFWELPGGKVDPGETPSAAAARELSEEVGLSAEATRPWLAYDHAFPLRRVRLSTFLVDRWSGEPKGREGQRIAWVDPAAPGVAPILPSVRRALFSISLPDVYPTIRLDAQGGASDALKRLADAFASGRRLVRLTADAVSPDQRVILARRAQEIARGFGARILLSGTALEAQRAGVAGAHTRACALSALTTRPRTPVWAVTCRDRSEFARAIWLGADFVVLRHGVAAESGGLEMGEVRQMAQDAPIPVYAERRGEDVARLAPQSASGS